MTLIKRRIFLKRLKKKGRKLKRRSQRKSKKKRSLKKLQQLTRAHENENEYRIHI
jgi:hypothetical protein